MASAAHLDQIAPFPPLDFANRKYVRSPGNDQCGDHLIREGVCKLYSATQIHWAFIAFCVVVAPPMTEA
jgi:hypothetical protein